MLVDLFPQCPYIVVALVALITNIPLGYIRENTPKFSLKWFFWIHASIPLLVYLRITLDVSHWFIPVSIFFAVIGQIYGSRLRRKHMSVEQKECLQQISRVETGGGHTVPDADVMVVLLNMGGPRTNADVKDFQKRLFSDPLLIRLPMSWAFQRLFAWFLVLLRSKKAEKRYRLIGGGSPIFNSTQDQARALQEELVKRGRRAKVTFSFNYSSPLPGETIYEVKKSGRKHILPISLYPHYSKATTGSSIHYLKKAAEKVYPEARFLNAPDYYLHAGYILAFKDRITETLEPNESLDDFYLLFSAHGLPLYLLKEGDAYPFQVAQTVSSVVQLLGHKNRWSIAYQSAVGPLQWMKPATKDMIDALARRGIKKLLVVPVSFVTDHIETTCEINIECRKIAEKLGINDFRMSGAIECHPGFITALADSVEKALT